MVLNADEDEDANANATATATAIANATAIAIAIAIATGSATGSASAGWVGSARRSHAPEGRRSQKRFGLHKPRFARGSRSRLRPRCGEGIRMSDGGGLAHC